MQCRHGGLGGEHALLPAHRRGLVPPAVGAPQVAWAGVGEMVLLCLPTGFFFASVAALVGSLSSQEHLATLVCCLLWLAALLTRSLLRLPGVEYVYPFLRFAGDQHGVWLWNKAALTGTGLLLWVGWWLCGKRK